MNAVLGRFFDEQHGVAAAWQLRRHLTQSQINVAIRGCLRVHRGVYAREEPGPLGWFMAAALAGGPGALISHRSAVMLTGLRPYIPHVIDVTVPGRNGRRARAGLRFHRPRVRLERWSCHGIPVVSPTRALAQAELQPYERYRALEEAERKGLRIDHLDDVARLRRAVRGRTRSDAEARFILLCDAHRIALPLVNHRVNGLEAFEEDRRRNLVHRAAGFEVLRVSARQVAREPERVAAALSPS